MELKAIIIGGAIPALLLGLGTVLMKLSLKHGISLAMYITTVGFAILFCGFVMLYLQKEYAINTTSSGYALTMGVSWSLAIFCMSYAISKLGLPISIIAPLTNSNAVVAVLLGALVFSEFKNLDMQKVLIGTLLIVIGAIVVSNARID